jgi:basic amino acid/polyamine antiporter, APA family
MATTSTTPARDAGQGHLFVRQASGLVRGWSSRDGFIYAAIAVNPIILGLYTFSLAPAIPQGSLLWAVIISGLFIAFEVIVYSALITVIPRAGGDYVWQSRILHGSLGFVLAVTGWWFIMWHWTPIYAGVMVRQVIDPLLVLAGARGVATWFTTQTGTFVSCLIVIGFCATFISIGMRGYAKLQRACFYVGVVFLLVVLALLLFSSKGAFHSAFDREAAQLYGAGPRAYDRTLAAGGYHGPSLWHFSFGPTFMLIPMVIFWNLWANWGATLYGEVRGASDFKRNVRAMGGGLLVATVTAIVFFVLIDKTMGWNFYNAANNAYWGGGSHAAPLSAWPYPAMLAGWLIHSHVLQFVVILGMSAWFLGYVGNLFLSSSRVVFAAAFDRVLPAWGAHVSARANAPTGALVLTCVPAIGVSAVYAYSSTFTTYTLDATLVVAVMYLGTTIAAGLLPWRAPRLYEASPLARWQVAGVPMVTAAAAVFAGFLVFNLVMWFKDGVYGVNNAKSLGYMAVLYAVAIAIYLTSRLVQGRRGVSLAKVQSEIPLE